MDSGNRTEAWGMNWHAPTCNQGAWAHGYLHLTDLRNKHGPSWNDRLWDQQRPLPIGWNDLDHLASWVHGYDIEWPGMKGYFDALPDYLKEDWVTVLGAEHRKLHIHGTQHLTASNDPDPTVRDVTDEVKKRDGIEVKRDGIGCPQIRCRGAPPIHHPLMLRSFPTAIGGCDFRHGLWQAVGHDYREWG